MISNGDVVSVLVIYGLAASVFAHTPDVCYRSQGFAAERTPIDREIMVPGWPDKAHYRGLYFSKKVGALTQYTEVVYTFLHNEEWLPEVASRWKMFRYHPGMFKIQIERHVSQISLESSPSPGLLKELMRAINNRVAESKPRAREVKKSQG